MISNSGPVSIHQSHHTETYLWRIFPSKTFFSLYFSLSLPSPAFRYFYPKRYWKCKIFGGLVWSGVNWKAQIGAAFELLKHWVTHRRLLLQISVGGGLKIVYSKLDFENLRHISFLQLLRLQVLRNHFHPWVDKFCILSSLPPTHVSFLVSYLHCLFRSHIRRQTCMDLTNLKKKNLNNYVKCSNLRR